MQGLHAPRNRAMSNHTDIGDSTTLGRKTLVADMPLRAVVFRWAVGLGSVGTFAALIWLHPPLSFASLGIFLTAAVIADVIFRVRTAPGAYFTFTPAFTFVYFLAAGGVAAATLELLARSIAWAIGRFRQKTTQTALYGFFEVGLYVLAALAASVAVDVTVGRPYLLGSFRELQAYQSIGIFAAVYFAVILILTSTSMALRTGLGELKTPTWRRIVMWLAVSIAFSALFALITWELTPRMTLIAALIVPSILMIGTATILRLNVGLRRGNEELLAINRIGQLLSATLDSDQLFRLLARETRSVIPWDAFFIALPSADGEKIQITFFNSDGGEIAQRTIPKGVGLTGRAIENREPILYERPEGENTNLEDSPRIRRRPRSILVAPMVFGSESIGAISLQNLHTDVYTREQQQLLQTIASQAATALRNAELLRREQKAIAERDEFLSVTTHEIKNPLTSVLGYLQIARAEIEQGHLESAAESLDVVESEALKIQRFAEDLLEVSRIGGGRFTIRFGEADLERVVSEVVRRYGDTSEHEVYLRIDSPLPKIVGDEIRLGQVVENLISNAIKYSPNGRRVDVVLSADDEMIVLRVSDQGIGIPASKVPLIFERFYRVENEGEMIKGTGLGLFISREIVRMHGGEVAVESVEGTGSVFSVELPVGGPRGRKLASAAV